jgi:hypothetical protein
VDVNREETERERVLTVLVAGVLGEVAALDELVALITLAGDDHSLDLKR